MPQIVAFGGGGFSMEAGNGLLDDYVLALTGKARPRVCFLPTASGDADHYLVRFYQHFGSCAEPSHLSLFRRERGCRLEPRAHLLEQDLIYVGGGSVVSMLGVWNAHGIDAILREAWEQGVLLTGWSAGMICWFEHGVTDSFGPELAAMDCLGFLPGSACPHYDSEERRRPTYTLLVADGFPAGVAADDDVGLRYVGTELSEVVTTRAGAAAYRVGPDGEERLDPIVLR